ncbi:hypothetical protein PAEPH01_0724 [Pancytospora epiphaga]|nr:hypothetical protein PAEPH01_0724 [Pancytospora epiphaga]
MSFRAYLETPMDEMLRQKSRIETELQKLKSTQSDKEFEAAQLSREIKELASSYDKRCCDAKRMKAEISAKEHDCVKLEKMVKSYRESRAKKLESKFRAEIMGIISQINAIDVPMKVLAFKKLELLKNIPTDKYPILHNKKNELMKVKKAYLHAHIIDGIKDTMHSKSRLHDLIFYINFSVRFEIYFTEKMFTVFLFSFIENKFTFHFMSNRESNRLDRPEWMFEYLLDKYIELEQIFKIYADCYSKQTDTLPEYKDFILETQSLVELKITELEVCDSKQRRALVFHFATEYQRFGETLGTMYGLKVQSKRLESILHSIETQFIKVELARIHELKYVQWFQNYQLLYKDCLVYISRFHLLDPTFKLYRLTKLIVTHTQIFLENLSFTNREEIRIACFLYSQQMELRKYIGDTEGALLLERNSNLPGDEVEASSSKLNALSADIIKLIKNLAEKRVLEIISNLKYFNYISGEVKRAAIVDIYKTVEDFRNCSDYGRIEPEISGCLDRFFLDDVILKVPFSSEEYLEFREFYLSVKSHFSKGFWRSDEGCKAIEALLEGKKIPGEFYRKVRGLYKSG